MNTAYKISGIALVALAAIFGSAASAEANTLTVISVNDVGPNQLFKQDQWFEPVLEPLARQNVSTGLPEPVLAKSWSVAADQKSVVFKLKDNVSFHDGKPLTSDAVIFSLREAAKPQNNSNAFGAAQRIEAIMSEAPGTVTVRFVAPTSNMWDLFYQTPIMDPETFSGIANGSKVNGTGPFSWTTWKVGSELILKKNLSYRDAADVHFDEIDVLVIKDPSAQQAALRSGRAQLAYHLTAQDAKSLIPAGFALTQGAVINVGMGMNTSVPPFNNVLARRAVGYAIDRKRLVQQANAGIGRGTALWWNQSTPGWSEELANFYQYDPERAQRLVKEAGVEGAAVPLIFPASPQYLSYYNIIADGLKKAGFVPTAVQIERNDAVARLLRGDLGPAYLYYDTTTARLPSSVVTATPIFRSGEVGPNKYQSPEYSKLVDAVQDATPDQLSGRIQELSKFLLDVAFNHAFVEVPTVIVSSKSIDVGTPGANAPVFNIRGSLTGVGIRPAK